MIFENFEQFLNLQRFDLHQLLFTLTEHYLEWIVKYFKIKLVLK